MNDSNQPWWERAFGPGPEPDAKAPTEPAEGCGYAALVLLVVFILFGVMLSMAMNSAMG